MIKQYSEVVIQQTIIDLVKAGCNSIQEIKEILQYANVQGSDVSRTCVRLLATQTLLLGPKFELKINV